jgi:hypothetical protein
LGSLAAPTIATAIRMLAGKDLIKKEADPVDQRNQWLIPTEHALGLFSALSQIGTESKANWRLRIELITSIKNSRNTKIFALQHIITMGF